MDRQTAETIANAVADIADIKLRLTALETVLEQQQPSLYAEYLPMLTNLRKSTAHQWLMEGLASLGKNLQSQ